MVQHQRLLFASEHTREHALSPDARQQIRAADDHVDRLRIVIHGDGKLVGPVTVTVAHQQVAALRAWLLCLRAEEYVVEVLNVSRELYAARVRERRIDCLRATRARVHDLIIPISRTCCRGARDVAARALTRVHQMCGIKRGQRRRVSSVVIGLPHRVWMPCVRRARCLIAVEAEPRKIIKQRRFKLWSTACAIVVFNAQDHHAAVRARDPPDKNGVDEMAEMQTAGWRRRKSRSPWRRW